MVTFKRLLKKLIMTMLVILVLFNTIKINYTYADDDDSTDKDEVTWMGILAEPITFLVSGIGDAIIDITQRLMFPGSPEAVKIRYENEEAQSGEKKVVSKIKYGPAAIFSNVVPMLDINFINPSVKNPFLTKELTTTYLKKEGYNTKKRRDKILEARDAQVSGSSDALAKAGNSASILYNTISKWYVALRNIAILGLLVVLVYIGIRILISSTADEKSNYKKMLKDWVMAIILVIVIHYIMLILVTSVQIITGFLSGSSNVFSVENGDIIANEIRNQISNTESFTVKKFGYSIVYFVLILYTITFTVRYIKRVIYLAFLTLISPMVALTYPLDKIKDGRSQAFNMWFKEYLFNLLIQPIHLLLYIVFVSAAMDLAKTNMIYALIAIGFILQAETFIKQMFGIKAEGGAAASGFAAGMAFSSVVGTMQKGSAGLSKVMGGGGSKIRMPGSGSGSGGDSSGGDGGSGGKSLLTAFGGKGKEDGGGSSEKGGALKKITGAVGNVAKKVPGGAGLVNVAGKAAGVAKTGVNAVKKAPKTIKNKASDSFLGKFSRTKFGQGAGNLRKKYVNKNLAKKAGRLATKAYTGAALGAMGVAAGLASNDFSNVLSYGALGAAGGAKIGDQMVNQAGGIVDGAKEGVDTFQRGYLGDEYKELEQKREAKEIKNDYDMRTKMQDVYGSEWASHKDEIDTYVKNGVTNQDDIIKGMKMTKKDDKLTTEQAAQAISFANGLNRDDFSDSNSANTRKKIESMGVTGDNVDKAYELARDYKLG